MGAKQSENSNTNYYSIKAKTDDKDPTPFIGKVTKSENGWGISEKFDEFDGYLVDIEHGTYEYEGETKHKCKMTFFDTDGTRNMLESNFNNLFYSLLNSLAGCESPELIQLNVYLGKAKAKEDGTMGKQWASVLVKNNGEDTEWKIPPADMPRPKKVAVPNTDKTVDDDSEVIAFWQKIVLDIKGTLKPSTHYVTVTEASAATQAEASDTPAETAPATEQSNIAPETDANAQIPDSKGDDLNF